MVRKITPQTLRNLLGLLIAILISTAIFIFKDEFTNLGRYGYLSIFLISLIGNATIILPAPVVLTAFAGGSVLNPLAVGLLTALGATIGELTGYLAGMGGRVIIENYQTFRKLKKIVHRYGNVAIFILAFIPNPLFDLAGITAGMYRFKPSHFLLATLAGKTLKFILVALLGASIVY